MQEPVALAPQSTEIPEIKRLLIVRLGAMGDILHSLPAANALRLAFPQAVLGWLIEERWAELLCTLPTPRSGPRSPQRPLVDRIHTVNTKRWRTDFWSYQTWEQIAAGLSELRAARYEIAVDLQGAVKSAILASLSQARAIFGAAQPRENIASMWYTHQVITRGTHVVEQNLSIAQAVTRRYVPVPQVELPRDEAIEEECEHQLAERGIQDFALLNPGAGWGAKQWPAERYGQVARELARDGLRSLINFGPGEEELARQVERESCGAAETVGSSLTQLIAITRRARIFVGGDTGPMHLAAALGVPVVAIFGPTNPARNGPFGTRAIVLRSPASTTSHQRRTQPDEGLFEITVEQVVDAVRQLMRSPRA